VSKNTTPHIGEIESQLMQANALRGNAAKVLDRYHRARTRLSYLRLAACDPASLMAGGKLPPSDDAEMNALTPSQLDKCAAEAMEYLQSLLPPK
jgi:hypothetical protein